MMILPTGRQIATISIAISVGVVLCAPWWLDHERLNQENLALRRQLQSVEMRLHEFYRDRDSSNR